MRRDRQVYFPATAPSCDEIRAALVGYVGAAGAVSLRADTISPRAGHYVAWLRGHDRILLDLYHDEVPPLLMVYTFFENVADPFTSAVAEGFALHVARQWGGLLEGCDGEYRRVDGTTMQREEPLAENAGTEGKAP